MSSTKVLWIGLLASFISIFVCINTHKDNLYTKLYPNQIPLLKSAYLHYSYGVEQSVMDVHLPLAASNGLLSQTLSTLFPQYNNNIVFSQDVSHPKWESVMSAVFYYLNEHQAQTFNINTDHKQITFKGTFAKDEDKAGFVKLLQPYSLLSIVDKTNVALPVLVEKEVEKELIVDEKVERVVAQTQEKINTLLSSKRITFTYSSAKLTKESKATLDSVLQYLKTLAKVKIDVEGHTDARGSRAKNQRLSLSRAKAVRDYLIKGGFDGHNVRAVGFGDKKPQTKNRYAKENRRVEIIIKEEK